MSAFIIKLSIVRLNDVSTVSALLPIVRYAIVVLDLPCLIIARVRLSYLRLTVEQVKVFHSPITLLGLRMGLLNLCLNFENSK